MGHQRRGTTQINRTAKNNPNDIVNVLSLQWNTVDDRLTYPEAHKSTVTTVITKREVAKMVFALYDPLGFLSPIHVCAKLFLQQLWKEKFDWDEPLPGLLENEWIKINIELNSARDIDITRRCISSNEPNPDCTLHVFADASSKAYGAVLYLQHGNNISLIISKTRLAPPRNLTLPRIELMATLIGASLGLYVQQALTNVNITKKVLWSDSQITIHWIKGSKKLPTFVENRVREIRKATFDDI
ncbi:uncharacterized protein LOC144355174 [Saccoglossus kowalevskii]